MIRTELRRKRQAAIVFLIIMLALLLFNVAGHNFLMQMIHTQAAAFNSMPDNRPGKANMVAALNAMLSGDLNYYLYYQWIGRGFLQVMMIFSIVLGVFDILSERADRFHYFALNFTSRRRWFLGKALSGWTWIGILTVVLFLATLASVLIARWGTDIGKLALAFLQIGLCCVIAFQILLTSSLALRGKGVGYWITTGAIVLMSIGFIVGFELLHVLFGFDGFMKGESHALVFAGIFLASVLFLHIGSRVAGRLDM
jgi:hypothetical protein